LDLNEYIIFFETQKVRCT